MTYSLKAAVLPDRRVLAISGVDRVKFLQGLMTNDIRRLGGPASHGCVRLHPSHAAALYALVQRNGSRNTRIEIN